MKNEHPDINDLYRPNETGLYLKGEAARIGFLALYGLDKLIAPGTGGYTAAGFAMMLSEIPGENVDVKTAGRILNSIRLYGIKTGRYHVKVETVRIGPKRIPAMSYRIIIPK